MEILVFVFLIVLILVSHWKIFIKADKSGWSAITPFVNLKVFVEISGLEWWWFLLLFVPYVNLYAFIVITLSIAEVFGKGRFFGIGLMVLPFIFYPILAFGNSVYVGPEDEITGLIEL